MSSIPSKLFAILLFSVPVLGVMVFAQAQDEEGTEETSAEGEVDVQKQANLTPEEQLAEAEKMLARGARTTDRIRSLLNEARTQNDIIRITCLNDKYTQANAHSRNLTQRHEQLRDSVGAGNDSERNHHFTVMSVLDQNIILLGQEAAQCVGEDMFETGGGATKVITTIDPGSPVVDPTFVIELPDDIVPLIPPPTSTTM